MSKQVSVQIQFQPLGKRVAVPVGRDLLEAAREAGIDLASACGGEGNCGQCRVIVLNGKTSALSLDETFILSDRERLNGERLACCTHTESDVSVEILRESLITGPRLQLASNLRTIAVDPMVQAYQLELSPPSLEDTRSDLARLINALSEDYGLAKTFASAAVVRQLSPILREQKWQVTVTVRDREIVGLGLPGSRPLGFAVDLGTTKIAAFLIDLQTGEELAAAGAPNPQIGYGEDVISRLNYVYRNEDGGRVLAGKVRQTLDDLLGELVLQSGSDREQIVDACIVGNTAMTHLLLELPVAQLAKAPFVAAASNAISIKAAELGLTMAPGADVYIPPSIGGFVGADHVAMILACDLDMSDKITLAIDIGTNSEIAIRKPGMPFLNAISCASGPAFEGAHIGNGMRAASGAIEKVRITEDGPLLMTVDDAPPVGLCGSGIVDVVAELYGKGLINYRGRFERENVNVEDGRYGYQYLLAPARKSGNNHDIAVTQKDINEIQLAKGAINAGLSILLTLTGTLPDEVEEVIIAGAFGSYLNVNNAIRMGLFPRLPHASYRQVGNAAAIGAKWMLVSREARKHAQEIAGQTQYQELTAFPKFSRRFALGMLFPTGENEGTPADG
jgi:uncharacterized 2Fe-2S/4Fe-4S cluster protein (DUF4445 family)